MTHSTVDQLRTVFGGVHLADLQCERISDEVQDDQKWFHHLR
jgi:hypothetical protein